VQFYLSFYRQEALGVVRLVQTCPDMTRQVRTEQVMTSFDILGHVWTSLIMPKQVRTCLNKSEHAWTSLNMLEQVWTCLNKSDHTLTSLNMTTNVSIYLNMCLEEEWLMSGITRQDTTTVLWTTTQQTWHLILLIAVFHSKCARVTGYHVSTVLADMIISDSLHTIHILHITLVLDLQYILTLTLGTTREVLVIRTFLQTCASPIRIFFFHTFLTHVWY